MTYTIEEIEAFFPALPIREVSRNRYALWSLSIMEKHYRDGGIDEKTYDAYRALWRNGTFRFSDVCIEFDINHINNLNKEI